MVDWYGVILVCEFAIPAGFFWVLWKVADRRIACKEKQ